jgi:hypothetical protein
VGKRFRTSSADRQRERFSTAVSMLRLSQVEEPELAKLNFVALHPGDLAVVARWMGGTDPESRSIRQAGKTAGIEQAIQLGVG